MKPLIKRFVFAVFAAGLALFVLAIAAEVVLRVLPTRSSLASLPVNAESPVFRFTPDREFTFSRGPLFSIVTHGRVNNDGFISGVDYNSSANSPLLAVIGDSYVEALMVPFEETLAGRLSPDCRVYGFGASGAPMSQYLVWAGYTRERYGADSFVFIIIGNDYDESLITVKNAPGFHYFARGKDGELHLTRVDKADGRMKRILRKSALARYLVLNLEIRDRIQRLKQAWKNRGVNPASSRETASEFVGNTEADAAPPRVAEAREGVDAFFRELPEAVGVSPDRVLFLIDGMRPQIYQGEGARAAAAKSFVGVMNRYFLEKAGSLGYKAVDLGPVFRAQFLADGERFEFPDDNHWNARAHARAARVVEEWSGFPCKEASTKD